MQILSVQERPVNTGEQKALKQRILCPAADGASDCTEVRSDHNSAGCTSHIRKKFVVFGIFKILILEHCLHSNNTSLEIGERFHQERIEVPPNRPTKCLDGILINIDKDEVGIRLEGTPKRVFP
jgi:hypothetical protein